jgi:hypothetical protein
MKLVTVRLNNYISITPKYICLLVLSTLIFGCDKAGPLTIQGGGETLDLYKRLARRNAGKVG